MEVGQSGTSFAFVQPDPDSGPEAFKYCLDVEGNEIRTPALATLKQLEAATKQRISGDIYILHQTDRVIKKI